MYRLYSMANKIKFIDADPDVELKAFIAEYEALSGKKLQPAQAERILIQAGTNRIVLLKNQINETANQNLGVNAAGVALELLAEIQGVFRLPPQAAQCIIRFNLVNGHGPLNIPEGIRVQSIDGQLIFITVESKNVEEEATYVDIKAMCTTEGKSGNGYAAGEIAVILDPKAYVSGASNVNETNGGSDEENDDEFRERLFLAPAAFSVAGPSDAYKFHAKSAHPLIIDVAVKDHTPEAGSVSIYPLLLDGEEPSEEILDAVYAACNSKKVRPLNDTVVVAAATKMEYTIQIQLVLLNSAVQEEVLSKVNANLAAYIADRKTRLGVNVVRSQLIKEAQVEGVYSVTVVQPSADLIIDENEYSWCTANSVTVTGTSDE